MIGKRSFARDLSGLDEDGNWRAISEAEAGKWLEIHRQKYPSIPFVHKQVEQMLQRRGYLQMWDGSVFVLPPMEDPHKGFPWLVQKGGAQLLKRSMVKSSNLLRELGYDAQLILQVHDEVVYEAPTEQIEEVGMIIAHAMATQWPGCEVPLYVQPEVFAPSWAQRGKMGVRVPYDEAAWLQWRKSGVMPEPPA
jgi:DNA polymerase-1